jgi:molybdate transport repressor ModE-like protein
MASLASLQPLRYLISVARTGSISAAARELRVSQPSVSNAIKALESELSTTLLSRRRDGVVLTATGQELLHYASEALRLLSLA